MYSSAREQNIRAFLDYWRSGIKGSVGAIGIELEHTIVHAADRSAVSYSEHHGVQWVLTQLLHAFPHATYDEQGDLLGVSREDGGVLQSVTLEPAAQLELSAGPFTRLSDALACFEAFEEQLAAIVEPAGMSVLLRGYHPAARACDLELIPKQRYEFMDRYFAGVGPWGARMMRGSASTQVSIDYTGEADCLRKLRLAYQAAPLFAFICDNSPVFEGAPSPHALMRTRIWQGCDPSRCGVVPGIFDPAFSLRDYAEYVLGVPAILVPEDAGWRYTEEPFGRIYAQQPMTRADAEHAVSMTFTDVRLKTYIEVRPADALPVPRAIAYAALVKGLFADEETLSAMEALFEGAGECEINQAKCALMRAGSAATVYGRPAVCLARTLFDIADRGLSADERVFLDPLALAE